MAEQLILFGPNLNIGPRLKAAMRESIKGCSLSREQLADEMKKLASADGLGGGRGSTISAANIDAWVCESKTNLIPTNLLTIFCKATGDMGPMKVLAGPLGGSFVTEADLRLLAWARLEVQARSLARRKRKILSEIEGEIP